jgi:hypothetical protein
MPSPFPGMNPYVEQDDAWHDFRKRFIPLSAEIIGAQVPQNYIVKIAKDIHVDESLTFIEIRDRRNRGLVTVIELLSLSNKRAGPDREQYLAKRGELLSSPVHLVEIDLLRCGEPMPSADRPACDDSVMVSRAEHRPRAGFWPVALRDRLPVVPIPVRASDPDARLDLQDALHRLYDAAGYQYYIYTGMPDLPLSPDGAAWAQPLVP